MPSVEIISYKGKKIVYNDMADARPEESIACCLKSQEIMKTLPLNSAYVLADCTNMRFNSDTIQVVKETTRNNKPYVHTTAVVGLEGFTKILVKVVVSFSGRDMKLFDSVESAKEWLFERMMEEETAMAV